MSHSPSLRFVIIEEPSGPRKIGFWDWPAQNGNNAEVTVCVHGLSRQARDFDTLAADLGADRRVVAVDVAGRGESDWLADPLRYQVPTYAQDLVAVLTQLKSEGAQHIDWVGTSMGGLIGMAICGHEALKQAFPIRRLVLNDVGPALQWAAIARIASYLGKNMVFENPEAAAQAMWQLSSSFGPHTPEEWLALSRPMTKPRSEGGVRLHYDPAIVTAFSAATEQSTAQGAAMLWALYDNITAKTLVIRGSLSDLLTAETVRQMAARGPKATCVEFAGVGHAPTLIAPDQRAAIRQFLDAP